MFYLILKWLHILCAITALGANITYFLWLFRMDKNRESLLFTLRTIKIMDDTMANPAYVLAFFTGAGMLSIAKLSYATPWVLTALIIYAVVSLLGIFVYSPLLKKQIKLAESVGPDSAEYKRAANNGIYLGILITLLVVGITFLMVVKPHLW
jgi:uncharacterized membrane protein